MNLDRKLPVRPDKVALLAAAYRKQGTPLADALIAGRYQDFTAEERLVARAESLADAQGNVVLFGTRQKWERWHQGVERSLRATVKAG